MMRTTSSGGSRRLMGRAVERTKKSWAGKCRWIPFLKTEARVRVAGTIARSTAMPYFRTNLEMIGSGKSPRDVSERHGWGYHRVALRPHSHRPGHCHVRHYGSRLQFILCGAVGDTLLTLRQRDCNRRRGYPIPDSPRAGIYRDLGIISVWWCDGCLRAASNGRRTRTLSSSQVVPPTATLLPARPPLTQRSQPQSVTRTYIRNRNRLRSKSPAYVLKY